MARLLLLLTFAIPMNAPAQSLELFCQLCSPSGITPDECNAQLQNQVDAPCGGQGEITGVQQMGRFAGGFCFDGKHGGRVIGLRNAVTFTCATSRP